MSIINSEELLQRIKDKSKKKILIYGAAGTGKTTYIINLLRNINNNRIYIVAPTNKALEVLVDKIGDIKEYEKITNMEGELNENKIRFLTLAKLLKLRKVHKDNLKISFEIPKDNKKNIFSGIDILIIDEVSMIDEIHFNYIIDSYNRNRNNIKIIFSGDKYQLPPINEHTSPIFNYFEGIHIETGINEKIELEKIHRTDRKDIIELCTKIREWIDDSKISLKDIMIESESVKIFRNKSEFINSYYENNKEDNDNMLLVWKNETREKYNNYLMDKIRGKNRKSKYSEGDKIIFLSYYKTDQNKYYSSIKKSIVDVDESEKDCGKIYYKLVLELLESGVFSKYNGIIFSIIDRIKEKGINMIFRTNLIKLCNDDNVNIINEDSKKRISRIIEEIRDIIINEIEELEIEDKEEIEKLKMIMISYIDKSFNEPFAEIDYGYCMTVDKSQGSQFNTVYIDVSDIMNFYSSNENMIMNAKKRLYTGLTRSEKRLNILL